MESAVADHDPASPTSIAAQSKLPPSNSSSPNGSRRSSTVRLRPHKYRSNSSLRLGPSTPAPTTPDDQSLTSFPSLSPSLETSPSTLGDILETPKAHRNCPSPPDRSRHQVTQNTATIPPAFEGLFSPTTAPPLGQPALFDDASPHAGIRDVPGTLHYQSDEHVEQLIARQGAVALVKQLALDLAKRDAQVTLLQRRAEERESLLRKMLRECEVSNMDVELRLRELRKTTIGGENGGGGGRGEGWRTDGLGTRPDASIQDRLAEAFEDAIEREDLNELSLDDAFDASSTVRGPRNPITHSGRSTSSSTPRKSQGWTDYLRYATGTVKGNSTVRTSLTQVDGLQQGNGESRHSPSRYKHSGVEEISPPRLSRTASRAESLHEDLASQRNRKPSNAGSDSANSAHSVTSWAMKLVAGGSKTSRGRAATISSPTSKAPPTSRTNASRSASNRSSLNTAQPAYGPTGTVRRAPPDGLRNPVSGMLPPTSPELSRDAALHLGPVEMDTIVPEETRPPTLVQYRNYGASQEYLTDRFGFIYDQRRRRRQNEAAAAQTMPPGKWSNNFESVRGHRQSMDAGTHQDDVSVRSRASSIRSSSRPDTPASMEEQSEEPSSKRWHDYLKLTSFSGELLSHTPSAVPITEVTDETSTFSNDSNGAGKSQIVVSKRGSLPAQSTNPAPSPSRVVSENAELAQQSTIDLSAYSVTSESQLDPVKALLDQVNDVHDTLQRDRTVKWNEFLRKVRAERRRDGEQTSFLGIRSKQAPMPESLLPNGEVIGVAGLGVKGKVGRAKGIEFRNLVLSGIPVAYRAKIWAECCGTLTLRVPGYYEELVAGSVDNDPVIAQQIQMDITRTLTDNIFFRSGQGVAKLNEVLLAYARRNPDVGYCQGMNLITANLLLIMPTAEDAFYILTAIVETILPEKYYDNSLLTSRADQVVLRQYVVDVLPQLSAHLETLSIDLEAVTFQWFLSVFTDCLSAEALFRVWDVVLCLGDGATFLFQVALALLKLNEKALLRCESPAEVYGYINQRMTDHAISIDGLIRASEGLKKEVVREDIVERRRLAVEAELETARLREAIRKGKSKALLEPEPGPTPRPTLVPEPRHGVAGLGFVNGRDDGNGVYEVVSSRGKSVGRLTRQSSRTNFHEDEVDEWGGELTIRTPMPIDEEVLWRA